MNKEIVKWLLENEIFSKVGEITAKEKPSRTLWFMKILPDLDWEIN